MEITLTDFQTVGGAVVVIAVLTQLLKGHLTKQATPLVAVLLGIVVVVAAELALGHSEPEAIGNAVLRGLLAGAAAVGLYDVQKPVGLLRSKK